MRELLQNRSWSRVSVVHEQPDADLCCPTIGGAVHKLPPVYRSKGNAGVVGEI